MRQFVPMTDDLLYRAEAMPHPLVPYRAGLDCWHALAAGAISELERSALQEMAAINAANDTRANCPSPARQV